MVGEDSEAEDIFIGLLLPSSPGLALFQSPCDQTFSEPAAVIPLQIFFKISGLLYQDCLRPRILLEDSPPHRKKILRELQTRVL